MNGKTKSGILGLCLFISAGSISGLQKVELSKKHKQWLQEEVVYIITPKEKEVFYKLGNDREKDLFIEEFWRQRDPTPGTSQNEFKDEHYRRIEYANRKFGRETPTKGWRTDRGRIFIMLGMPASVQRYDYAYTHPIETWYYSKSPRYIRVSNFRLMFFKKHGGGEYELYHPISDGPAALVTTRFARMTDEEAKSPDGGDDAQALNLLKNYVSEELAAAAVSILPQGGQLDNISSASVFSSINIMGDIEAYPQKKVNDAYAYEFLEHKTAVEVSYSVHYMGNLSHVNVLQDPSGLFFVNTVISPEILSIDQYEDQFYTEIKSSYRLSDREGKTIYQGESLVPIRLKKEELERIEKSSFLLYDAFPVVPGTYTFNLLLENLVTKEFTSLEKNLIVPGDLDLHMSRLVLSRKIEQDSPVSDAGRAFQIGKLRIYPSINLAFHQDDTLGLFFQLLGLKEKQQEEGLLVFSFFSEGNAISSLRKSIKDYPHDHNILEHFSLEEFSPGKYRVEVSFFDHTGELKLWETADFSVTLEPLPGSWVTAQTRPPADDPYHAFVLGNQYLNKGDIRKARETLAAAYLGRPDSLEYALAYTRVLMEIKDWSLVKEILAPFAEADSNNYGLFYCLGKSMQETGRPAEAVGFYRKALSLKGSVVYVLNSLGECHFALGEKQQALEAWKKSLEIDPNQEKIKKLVETLR